MRETRTVSACRIAAADIEAAIRALDAGKIIEARAILSPLPVCLWTAAKPDCGLCGSPALVATDRYKAPMYACAECAEREPGHGWKSF